MSIKAALSKPFADWVVKHQMAGYWGHPVECQQNALMVMLKEGRNTAFGKDHGLKDAKDYEAFKKLVPIRDYEQLTTYINRVRKGEEDVLWPGKPIYFCKTSGTTSGAKYIPLTKQSLPFHIRAARNALLCYISETRQSKFVDGKMIFLQGSPELSYKEAIPSGRLSGIVAHHVPSYLQKNRLPSYDTNCIEDWEKKIDAIVEETISQNMTLISGIPSWVQMYFERLRDRTDGKKIREIFPNFDLFVYGGVNFEPYRSRFRELIGETIPSIETYPASEGFIAFQDRQEGEGLLLTVDDGIFYEFIPAESFFDENPPRLALWEVELNKNYALAINNNAGLWGYSIGDTVKFVSRDPYRILVTGRIKHFISAFGEHVIGEEVEKALQKALELHGGEVIEFTVAPQVEPKEGLPYHEWLVSFANQPSDLAAFAKTLDHSLQELNPYYKDLLKGNILRPAVLTALQPNAFQGYMKSIGKLGGQNKVPRLSNDRTIANGLYPFKL